MSTYAQGIVDLNNSINNSSALTFFHAPLSVDDVCSDIVQCLIVLIKLPNSVLCEN